MAGEAMFGHVWPEAKRKPRRISQPRPGIKELFCVADVVEAPQRGRVEPLRTWHGYDTGQRGLQAGGDGVQGVILGVLGGVLGLSWTSLGAAWSCVGLRRRGPGGALIGRGHPPGKGSEVIPLGAESRRRVPCLFPRLAPPASGEGQGVLECAAGEDGGGRGRRVGAVPSRFARSRIRKVGSWR